MSSDSSSEETGTLEPPTTRLATVRYLGPGLILAGSIVGSGELIATTRTGAEAGFSLLWLILLGCVVKVFTQVEICRHCITHGETTVTALDRIPCVGRFIAMFWLVTFLAGLGQLGGIVGGVGQALELFLPLFGERSDLVWAAVVTLVVIVMLRLGSFGFIETVCIALVGSFTLLTVGNLLALQTQPDWAIRGEDLMEGLRFGLPESGGDHQPVITALATFGIIGVGAAELVAYPYWCMEKGYGRYIGVRDADEGWASRARGWLRVLQWDAWGSMIVYTTSTAAFYLLGAAVLHRAGLIPARSEMIATLAAMYEPVFGAFGRVVLLVGAFAVLFSTFFVSNATKCRLMTDALDVFGLVKLRDAAHRKRWVRRFGVIFPLLCLVVYAAFPKPVVLVLLSGLMQALLLPLLGFAALWFRYRGSDPRLRSGRLWDLMLGLSFVCFLIVGGYLAVTKGGDLVQLFADRNGA